MQTTQTTPYNLNQEQSERIAQIARRYKKEPHQLMRILFDIQDITSNSLPHEAVMIVSEETGIPEAKLYGFMSFYAMFSPTPRGEYVIRMCESAPCHVRGAAAVMESIVRTLGVQPGETTEDGRFTLEYCPCMGLCEKSPAIMINKEVYTDLTPGRAATLIEDLMRGEEG